MAAYPSIVYRLDVAGEVHAPGRCSIVTPWPGSSRAMPTIVRPRSTIAPSPSTRVARDIDNDSSMSVDASRNSSPRALTGTPERVYEDVLVVTPNASVVEETDERLQVEEVPDIAMMANPRPPTTTPERVYEDVLVVTPNARVVEETDERLQVEEAPAIAMPANSENKPFDDIAWWWRQLGRPLNSQD